MRKLPEVRLRLEPDAMRSMAFAIAVASALIFTYSGRSAYAQNAVASTGTTTPTSSPAKTIKSGTKDTSSKSSGKPDDNPFGDFGNTKNRGPVNIQSDTMTLDYKGNAVLFKGNVHAKQADGDLWTNSLDVKYGKDFHQIEEMIAEGDVRMSQGQRYCKGDHGVMNQAAHTVVLTGSPSCHDDKDEISGDKIIVHLDTGKSDVEGRVKARIFPHDEKSRDNEVPANNSN